MSSFVWQIIIYTFKTIPMKAILTLASAILFRRELLHAASYAATLAISAVRPLRTCKTVTGPNSCQRLARESRLERVAGSLSRLMTSFPTVVLGIILLSGVVLGDPQGIDANGVRFSDQNINTAGIRHVNLPARGANYNPFTDSKANAAKQVDELSPSTFRTHRISHREDSRIIRSPWL